MNKGDKIKVLHLYEGKETESEGIFLGHRNETYMYSDDPVERARDEKLLVKIQMSSNEELIKEVDSLYPSIIGSYSCSCDNVKEMLERRITRKKFKDYMKPIYVCKVYLGDNTLTIGDQSFICEHNCEGRKIFTDGQLKEITKAFNNLIKEKNMQVEVEYSWRVTSMFRNNATERDVYIVGSSLSIENDGVNYSHDEYAEIGRVLRPAWDA